MVPLTGVASPWRRDGAHLDLDGRRGCLRRARPTSRTCRIDEPVTLHSERGGRFALCGARTDRSLPSATAGAPGSRSSCAGAGQSSRQVRNFGTPDALAAAQDHRLRGDHPGGNWSSYPAHKHDEASADRVRAGGDLLLRDRRRPARPARARASCGRPSSPGHDIELLEEVHDRDTVLVPYGWHGPCVAAPGLRHVLPERDGRARRRARLEDHRPPRPGLGARHLGRPGHRPPTDPTKEHVIRMDRDRSAHRRPGRREVPGRSVLRADGVRAEALRRLLRHLRPRQRGRHRPGAAAGRAGGAGRAAVHPGPQRAGHGAHRRRLRPDEEPAADLRRVTASVGPGATNMVTGAALATINRLPVLLLPADMFADRSASPLLQELELPYAGDVTVNDAFRPVSQVLRPGLAARAAAGRAARRRCGCSPTRPRPAR